MHHNNYDTTLYHLTSKLLEDQSNNRRALAFSKIEEFETDIMINEGDV